MYAKLFESILDSSVWLLPPHVRLVWITLLAAKNKRGFARFATVRNLANRAMVSVDEAQEAVQILEDKDDDSSDKAWDGRRIERVPGGWIILNAEKYDSIRKEDDRKEQNRISQQRRRERKASQQSQQTSSESAHVSVSVDVDVDTDRNAAHSSAPPSAERPDGRAIAKSPAARKPDPIWDTVANRWFGGTVARPHATRVGKIVRDLKELGADPREILVRADRIALAWGEEKATPETLVKHWCQFTHDPRPPKSDAERRREAADREFLDNLGVGLSGGGLAQLPATPHPMLEGEFR